MELLASTSPPAIPTTHLQHKNTILAIGPQTGLPFWKTLPHRLDRAVGGGRYWRRVGGGSDGLGSGMLGLFVQPWGGGVQPSILFSSCEDAPPPQGRPVTRWPHVALQRACSDKTKHVLCLFFLSEQGSTRSRLLTWACVRPAIIGRTLISCLISIDRPL